MVVRPPSPWAVSARAWRTTRKTSTASPAPVFGTHPPARSCSRSILGWKEYELEMMRDTNDNVVVVCSIENFDPWACTPVTPSPWPPH